MVRLSQLEHTTRRTTAPGPRQLSPEDTPATCRQRRRRRIEMRRARPNWPPARPPTLPKRRSAQEEDEDDDEKYDSAAVEPTLPRRWRLFRSPMPSFSEISIKGLAERSHVDGVVVVQEDFCPPEVFSGGEALHFFAVYDGHASALYKNLMHRIVAEELERVDHAPGSDGGSGGSDEAPAGPRSHRQWWNDHLLSALQRSFERMERVALGPTSWASVRRQSDVGSATAAVAILTAEHIVVACCGGASRVVLCSDGVPIPLCHDGQRQNKNNNKSKGPSDDHLVPDDHNEIRGYEVLEVSRPLGNQVLRSSSSSSSTTTTTTTEPEIFMIERSRDEDECLILASNSVWDVISDDVACNVANKCLRDANTTKTTTAKSRYGDQRSNTSGSTSLSDNHNRDQIDHHGGIFQSTAGIDAATLLCRLAIGRGSGDGISVVVVDLKRHSLL